MVKEEVALLMCGSFNPITNLHLRMFELAKDHLSDCGYNVTQGYISPVHDNYRKPGLVSISHRINMIKNALKSSDWIQLSTWEAEQKDWTTTYEVLRYHQDRLNFLVNNSNINSTRSPEDCNGNPVNRIKVKLLCGSDVVNTFSFPGLWEPEDIQRILTDHGLIVITRNGYDLDKIIYDNDLLFSFKKHLVVVPEYIENSVSSTKIRKACLRGLSIKYLVPDEVESYIRKHNLYHAKSKSKKSNETIRIPAEIFNDYKKCSANNKKLSIANERNNTRNNKQRKRKIKEITRTRKRSKKT